MVGELAAESSSDVAATLGLVAVGEVVPDDGADAPEVAERAAAPRLAVSDLVVHNDQDVPAVRGVDLAVGAGEVLGVAGVAATARWNWPRRWPASARCTPARLPWTAPISPAPRPAGG